jgi:hypothetical protein
MVDELNHEDRRLTRFRATHESKYALPMGRLRKLFQFKKSRKFSIFAIPPFGIAVTSGCISGGP